MRRPAKLLGVGTGIAMLLAMPLFSPSRALGVEGGPPVTGRSGGGIHATHATPSASTLDRIYGKLPMSFEKNAGQSPSGVDFIARGAGYSVFLTPGGAILAMRKQPPSDRKHIPAATQRDGSAAIRMALVGSSPARAAGEDELPGKANYFTGNEPAKWKTDVPTFTKVRYSAVYPGIDVVYYGNQGRLEYDFIVSPGADPEAITLAFTGATVSIDKGGDRVLAMAGGSASMPRPHIYHGGAGMEFGRGIAVDPLGNAYVAGQTGSSDFPTTPDAYQTTYGGSEDAFVAKINSSGSVLVYSTYLGGSGGDAANAIAVDPSGNAYVTGNNYLGGFPTKNALQAEYHAESYEAFVAKMAPDGALVYSTYLGGIGNDLGLGIAVDLLGNAYVVGYTQSPDFPTTPGAYQETNGGIYDAFVAKIAAPSVGKITGGGSIDVPGDLGTFGFTVRLAAPGAPIQGDLQYVNHATKTKVHSVTFTSFSVADTTAMFGGTCINNGVPCTFTVEVTDNGEPGVSDTFTINISGRPTEGGTLRSGNIQIHQ